MVLDALTLMFVSTALCLLTAVLVGYVRTGFPRPYRRMLRYWAQALLLQGLGWLGFLFQGVASGLVAVVLANTLLVLGTQRIGHAIHLFFDRPLPWRRDLSMAVATVVWLMLCHWVWPVFSARVIGVTVAVTWPLVAAILLFVRHARRPWPTSYRVVVAFLAAPALVLWLRALNQVVGTPVDTMVAVHPAQIALHMVASFTPAATALGFALMVATRLHDDLREVAFTDPLTGLANRRRVESLARPWIDDPQAPLSALMIDVDHFKRVNDRFGHDAGDEALVWLGSHLRVQARATDLVGRLGGEEFVMLLPGTTALDAAVLAERLRATVAAVPMSFVDHGEWPLTISIGVAARTPGDTDVRDLLRRADDAMYAAKRGGRNRVAMAD